LSATIYFFHTIWLAPIPFVGNNISAEVAEVASKHNTNEASIHHFLKKVTMDSDKGMKSLKLMNIDVMEHLMHHGC
jgi:hypothetical protein